jgi:hypothetical protein
MRQIHAGCARHIRESAVNVARTCRTRSAQQGVLLLDPSVPAVWTTVFLFVLSHVAFWCSIQAAVVHSTGALEWGFLGTDTPTNKHVNGIGFERTLDKWLMSSKPEALLTFPRNSVWLSPLKKLPNGTTFAYYITKIPHFVACASMAHCQHLISTATHTTSRYEVVRRCWQMSPGSQLKLRQVKSPLQWKPIPFDMLCQSRVVILGGTVAEDKRRLYIGFCSIKRTVWVSVPSLGCLES